MPINLRHMEHPLASDHADLMDIYTNLYYEKCMDSNVHLSNDAIKICQEYKDLAESHEKIYNLLTETGDPHLSVSNPMEHAIEFHQRQAINTHRILSFTKNKSKYWNDAAERNLQNQLQYHRRMIDLHETAYKSRFHLIKP